MTIRRPLLLCALAAVAACRGSTGETGPAPGSSAATVVSSAAVAPPEVVTAVPVASAAPRRPPAREGGTLAIAPAGDALYVADEDRGLVHVVALPLLPEAKPVSVPMPGQPAQVLALADRVLVTVRSAGAVPPSKGTASVDAGSDLLVPSSTGPGLLLVFRRDPEKGLAETARVELAQDAWGVAVTPDGATAIVTSAWTHRVSAVDLAAGKVLWSVAVAREPRAVVVRADGRGAYVTHLTGPALTRIDGLGGPPKVRTVRFPPAPLRTPPGVPLGASLAYSAALSPDGRRLFVPRHALGAIGSKAWLGAATADVLLTSDDTPLAPYRREGIGGASEFGGESEPGSAEHYFEADPMGPGHAPAAPPMPFVQPRAVAFLEKREALLVLGEGGGSLVELDARALDPAMHVLARYALAEAPDASLAGPTACGAPSGIAVSADEGLAWVHCRSTGDIVAVALDPRPDPKAPRLRLHLADDPLPVEAALGRRLFYDATDSSVSGGLGCAGCHPDGRDDGHVWIETGAVPPAHGAHTNFVSSLQVLGAGAPERGHFLRQTPMLAGRVAAAGPYGWQGESATLLDRVIAGFSLHRWDEPGARPRDRKVSASALQAFVRAGLVPPPHEERALTAKELRGRELFLGDETGCWTCHAGAPEYTNRKPFPVFPVADEPADAGAPLENVAYKTPSLRFVGGTPPYLHDGRFSTLAALIQGNDDHMGKTNQLSASDKAALVAFLETL